MKLSKDELIATLQDMLESVKADDSFEGSIQYTVFDDDLGADEFEVSAFYRVGNSMGQGGAVIIQAKQEPEERNATEVDGIA